MIQALVDGSQKHENILVRSDLEGFFEVDNGLMVIFLLQMYFTLADKVGSFLFDTLFFQFGGQFTILLVQWLSGSHIVHDGVEMSHAF